MKIAQLKDVIQEVEGNLDVPEIRVWCHPHKVGKSGDDYYHTFNSFRKAHRFISKHQEAEECPLIAFRGREINIYVGADNARTKVKFRVWDKKDKIMHLFDRCYIGRGFGTLLFGFNPPLCHTDTYAFEHGGAEQYYEFMQFTGLKDNNGKEIYEGDIVKCVPDALIEALANPPDLTRDASTVEYYGGAFHLCQKHHGADYIEDYITFDDDEGEMSYSLEITGNIYENPELMSK